MCWTTFVDVRAKLHCPNKKETMQAIDNCYYNQSNDCCYNTMIDNIPQACCFTYDPESDEFMRCCHVIEAFVGIAWFGIMIIIVLVINVFIWLISLACKHTNMNSTYNEHSEHSELVGDH